MYQYCKFLVPSRCPMISLPSNRIYLFILLLFTSTFVPLLCILEPIGGSYILQWIYLIKMLHNKLYNFLFHLYLKLIMSILSSPWWLDLSPCLMNTKWPTFWHFKIWYLLFFLFFSFVMLRNPPSPLCELWGQEADLQ